MFKSLVKRTLSLILVSVIILSSGAVPVEAKKSNKSKSKKSAGIIVGYVSGTSSSSSSSSKSSNNSKKYKVIENHDLVGDLGTSAQKGAFKAFQKYMKANANADATKFEPIVIYSGNFSQKDIWELCEIIDDEFFDVIETSGIHFKKRDTGNTDIIVYPCYELKRYQKNRKYEKKIQAKAQSICTTKMTDKQKSDKIQKWIINHTSYKRSAPLAWAAYNGKQGNCDAYSKLYKIMCNAVGVDCRIVIGQAGGGGHEWNRVKIGKTWYYADLAWRDTGDRKSTYEYSKSLWSNHKIGKDYYR